MKKIKALYLKVRLKRAIQSIFKVEDRTITGSVIVAMYGIAASNIGGVRKMPIDIVENVIEENQMPDYLGNDIKRR